MYRPPEQVTRKEGGRDETRIARWNAIELRLHLTLVYGGLSLCAALVVLFKLVPIYALRGGAYFVIAAFAWAFVYWVAWRNGADVAGCTRWATIYVLGVGAMLALGFRWGVFAPPIWWWLVAWISGGVLFVLVTPAALAATTNAAETLDPKWSPPSQAIERTEPIPPWVGLRRWINERWDDDDIREPVEPHVRAEIVSNSGRSMELDAKIPIAPDDLRKVALAVLRGDPFSEPGLERAISGGDYRKLKADFLRRGFVAWVDDDNHRLGVEVTDSGEQFLRQFVQQTRGEHVIRLPGR
jgi:hypothetical protein